ncbi:pilin [Photobacterium aquimaris]|uniref:Fimbrial protein n=1 Tax=Photobacterium aquimaris TaxID=512643 RepID=A0A1Y6KYX7_9GAMM|nr:pilin [Photobacterium aquimaris]SMY17242.1 Fimbrial protein precursor [Photobacterium aquimaris]
MNKQQGFTLIELMIVVAIIGVLSAFAIPAYKNYIVKSDIASGVATARGLLTNADLYIQENSNFPTALDSIGAGSDMSALGTISLIAGSGAAGTIKFLFDEKSVVKGSDASFIRSTAGWKCTFTPKAGLEIDETALPKGCNKPATI